MKQNRPIVIYDDNQAAIKISQSEKYHSRTKHIDVKIHFIRALQEEKLLEVTYCSTENMLTDMFTKPLAKPRLNYLISQVMYNVRTGQN